MSLGLIAFPVYLFLVNRYWIPLALKELDGLMITARYKHYIGRTPELLKRGLIHAAKYFFVLGSTLGGTALLYWLYPYVDLFGRMPTYHYLLALIGLRMVFSYLKSPPKT